MHRTTGMSIHWFNIVLICMYVLTHHSEDNAYGFSGSERFIAIQFKGYLGRMQNIAGEAVRNHCGTYFNYLWVRRFGDWLFIFNPDVQFMFDWLAILAEEGDTSGASTVVSAAARATLAKLRRETFEETTSAGNGMGGINLVKPDETCQC